MKRTICKIGNVRAVMIPDGLLKKLNLNVDDEVEVRANNNQIIIEPVRKLEYSLAELLSQCESQSLSLDEEDAAWLNAASTGKEAL